MTCDSAGHVMGPWLLQPVALGPHLLIECSRVQMCKWVKTFLFYLVKAIRLVAAPRLHGDGNVYTFTGLRAFQFAFLLSQSRRLSVSMAQTAAMDIFAATPKPIVPSTAALTVANNFRIASMSIAAYEYAAS